MTQRRSDMPIGRLAADQLRSVASGAELLGGGGGGDDVLARRLLAEIDGSDFGGVALIDPAELGDRARVVAVLDFLRLGAEITVDAAFRAVGALAQREGAIDAVVPVSAGAAPLLIAAGVAARSGLPLVDGVGSVRSIGHLNQTTWATGGLTPGAAFVADDDDTVMVLADGAESLEQSLETFVTGGSRSGAAAAAWLMDGPAVRRATIPHVVTLAVELGDAVRMARRSGGDVTAVIAAVIPGAETLVRGPVRDVLVVLRDNAERVEFRIDSDHGPVEIASLHAHVVVRDVVGDEIAGVPDLVIVVREDGRAAVPSSLVGHRAVGDVVSVLVVPASRVGGGSVPMAAFWAERRAVGAELRTSRERAWRFDEGPDA